jgi:hypothetical protein
MAGMIGASHERRMATTLIGVGFIFKIFEKLGCAKI